MMKKIIGLTTFLGAIASVFGIWSFAYSYGEKNQIEKMRPQISEFSSMKQEILKLKQDAIEYRKEISNLRSQNQSLKSSFERINEENSLVKKMLDSEKERLLKYIEDDENKESRNRLNEKYEKLRSLEYSGVSVSIDDCKKKGSRIECGVIFRAIEKDSYIHVRPETTIFDEFGNSSEVISYTSSSGKVINHEGYCSTGFQLIKDINTPYIFSFPRPSSKIVGVSAVKIKFGSGCMSADKILTFKGIALN